MPGAPPIARLVKAGLQLHGQGYGFEDLDVQLQADAIRLEYGTAAGVADSQVELDGVQLQFSGARFGWRIDTGELGLARLRLECPAGPSNSSTWHCSLKGRRLQTTLDAQLDWPALKVVGETLQGAALAGRLTLGGDQRLHLQLSSQAPSGVFERITVPALHVDAEGQAGSSTLQGKADATLVISPKRLRSRSIRCPSRCDQRPVAATAAAEAGRETRNSRTRPVAAGPRARSMTSASTRASTQPSIGRAP